VLEAHAKYPARDPMELECRFPGLRGRLPRAQLTNLPTPVHRLDRLAAELGIDELWVKRDDQSGVLYGGNKPRKLELLLGVALAKRKHQVLTFGGIGTHHGLATALSARSLGLHCILMLLKQPVTQHVRDCLLLDLVAGAELHYAPSIPRLAVRTIQVCGRALARGELPHIIPTGGTSALGTLGYVNAALELRRQIQAGELPEPDCIYVPLGSGGTTAGLVLGAKLAGLRSQVVAVTVTDILPPSRRRLAALATRSLAILRRRCSLVPDVPITVDDFHIIDGYVGASYGAPTVAGRAARDLIGELEGMRLETTYTAKCLAALIDATRSADFRGRRVLFWNTYSSIDPSMHVGPLPDYRSLPPVFHQFYSDQLALA